MLVASCGNEAENFEQDDSPDIAHLRDALQGSNYSVSVRDEGAHEANIIKPRITVSHLGPAGSSSLSNFALHFYFTAEAGKTPVLENYYTPLSAEVLVSLSSISAGLYRLEYRYTGQVLSAGMTLPDQAGSIVGLHYADWSSVNRGNDWSMQGVGAAAVETTRIVIVDENGSIVYGQPPPGVPAPTPSSSGTAPGGSGTGAAGQGGSPNGGSSGQGSSGQGGGNQSSGAGTGTGGTGGTPEPTGTDVSFVIKLPNGVGREEVALGATGGKIRLEEDAQVLGPASAGQSTFASVSAVGNAIFSTVLLEDYAKAHTVWADAKATLDYKSHVYGDLFSDGLVKASSARVDGVTNSQANVAPFEVVEWSAFFPDQTNGAQLLTMGETRTVEPGAYSAVRVVANSHLELSAGTYTFSSLTVELGGVIDVDNGEGPVNVYVGDGLSFGGSITRAVEVPNVVFAAAGTGTVSIKKAFTGILVTPNADLVLEAPPTGEHTGSFFGRSVTLRKHGKVRHEPFDPENLCTAVDECSVFCQCPAGAFPCENDGECSVGLDCHNEVCSCTPDCEGKVCGDDSADGCGSLCVGLCGEGESGCSTDAECAPGNVCILGGGPQKGFPAGSSVCLPAICREMDPHAEDCGVGGADCGPCPACVPDCEGRICGDDRCGGECGPTPEDAACIEGNLVSGWSREVGHSDGFPPPLDQLPPPEEELLDGSYDTVAGTLPGSFGVSDRGSAHYSIPLDLPPGRAGMQPALSLSYSSMKASGILGQGWALGGLSTIARCDRTMAQDGVTAPVELSSADAFCLDGQRLFPSTAANAQEGGVAYRTELESFRHIEAFTEPNPRNLNGPTRFKVWQKDGRIFTYGVIDELSESVITAGGVARVWGLSRIEDRVGNAIDFSYLAKAPWPSVADPEDLVLTELLPRAVAWGGFVRGGEKIVPHDRVLAFGYGKRTEPRHHYVAGQRGNSTVRVESIGVRVARDNGFTQHSIYELGYSSGDEPPDLLKSVQRCGFEASVKRCLPPTRFEYAPGDPRSVAEESMGFSELLFSESKPTVAVLDMDGDGRDEVIVQGRFEDGFAVITGNPRVRATSRFVHSVIDFAPLSWHLPRPQVIDFNDDGREDLLADKWWRSTGEEFQADSPEDSLPPLLGRRLADLDGDGRKDILSCLFTGERLYRNTGTVPAFAETPSASVPPVGDCADTLVLDRDGDGDEDVIRFLAGAPPLVLVSPFDSPHWEDAGFSDPLPLDVAHSSLACVSSLGGLPPAFCGLHVNVSSILSTDRVGALRADALKPMDANGDGLVDLFETKSLLLWLNTGRGFVATNPSFLANGEAVDSETRREWSDYMFGADSADVIAYDYDGDGRQDLLLPFFETCLRATDRGSFEVIENEEFFGFALSPGTTVTADTDGDGDSELLRFFVRGQGELRVRYLEGRNASRGFLLQVTDGLGRRTDVSYAAGKLEPPAPPEALQEYTYSSSLRAPLAPGEQRETRRIARVAPIVSRHSESLVDEETGETKPEANFDYRYFDAQAGLGGRGSYGFARRTIQKLDNHHGLQETTQVSYHNDEFWSAGLRSAIAHVSIATAPGQFADSYQRSTVTANTWELRSTPTSEQPHVWLAETTSLAFEDLGIVTSTNTTFEPDTFGNLAERVTVVEARGNEIERTSESTDFRGGLGAGFWLRFSPRETRVLHSRGGASARSRATEFEYEDTGLLRRIIRFPDEAQTTTTVFGRDTVFSNVISLSTHSFDETTNATETRFSTRIEYDEAGLFPIKFTNQKLHTSEVQYDDVTGNLLTAMDANGVYTQNSYDAFGRQRLTEGPTRKSTFRYFDADVTTGVPFVDTLWGAFMVRTENEDGGQVPDLSFSEATIDARGRLVHERGMGLFETLVERELAYDWAGRLLVQTTPHAGGDTSQGATHYSYDPSGPLSLVVEPDGRRTRFEQFSHASADSGVDLFTAEDAVYAAVSYTPGDLLTFSVADPSGLPVQISQVDTGVHSGAQFPLAGPGVANTLYSYGRFNQLETVVDPDGEVTSIGYDDRGRRTRIENSTTGVVRTAYDGFDQPVSMLDAELVNHCMEYDTVGRLRQLGRGGAVLGTCENAFSPENLISEWRYDGVEGQNSTGKLVHDFRRQNENSSAQVETEYHYETVVAPGSGRNSGRLQAIERRIPGLEEALVTSFEFDGPRVSTVHYPAPQNASPVSVRYDYDGFGNLNQVRDAASGADYWTLLEADQGQRVRLERFGNNVETDYRYASLSNGECALSDACIPGSLTRQRSGLANTELKDVRYSYDVMGNLSSRNRDQHSAEVFGHDGFNRLTSYAKTFANSDQESREYSYSAGGDIQGVITQRPDQAAQVRVYNYTGHRLNSVGSGESFTYDNNGNQETRTLLREVPGTDPPGTAFELIDQQLYYNDFNMPWRIQVDSDTVDGDVFLDYDADRNRVAKRGPLQTTLYAGDLYECVGPTPTEGTPVTCDQHRFKVYAGGRLITQLVQDVNGTELEEERRYIQSDHLGSATLLTDNDGVVQEDREFLPFGESASDFSETTVRSGFTGHEQDAELGLINMRGRLYDPGLGRFITPDPFVSEPFNPQGWNRYSYVQNNPLKFTDPTGFECLQCVDGPGETACATLCGNDGSQTASAAAAQAQANAELAAQQAAAAAAGAAAIDAAEAAQDAAQQQAINEHISQLSNDASERAERQAAEMQAERLLALSGSGPSADYRQPSTSSGSGNPIPTAPAWLYSVHPILAFNLDLVHDTWTALDPDSSAEDRGWAAASIGMAFIPELKALKGGQHIVLGLKNFGLEATAAKVGGSTLLKDPNWVNALRAAISDPATRFTVSLRGLSGATPYEKVMNAVQAGLRPRASPTNWELAQLYQAGRMNAVQFLDDAANVITNLF